MRSVAVTGQAGTSPTASRSTGTPPASGRPRSGTMRDRARAANSSGGGTGRASGRGFSAFKQRAKESGKKDSNLFTVDYNKKYVIAFLEPENYDTVGRHWVTIVGDDGTAREVPRNCIADPENDVTCPLCGIGMDPKPIALFNVIDLDQPDKVLVWEVSSGIFDKIDDLATELAEIPEDKGGPLELNSDGVYAVVSKKKKETKSGKGGVTEYTVARVKERDLDDDHSLDPLTAEQFEAALAKLNTSDQIKFNTYEELAEIAAAQGD